MSIKYNNFDVASVVYNGTTCTAVYYDGVKVFPTIITQNLYYPNWGDYNASQMATAKYDGALTVQPGYGNNNWCYSPIAYDLSNFSTLYFSNISVTGVGTMWIALGYSQTVVLRYLFNQAYSLSTPTYVSIGSRTFSVSSSDGTKYILIGAAPGDLNWCGIHVDGGVLSN